MGKILIGADPEIFVEDKNHIIPAFQFLPDKTNPIIMSNKQTCYWDGFQAEFTVKPSSDLNLVVKSIKVGLQTIFNKAKEKDNTAKLSKSNVIPVSLDYLKTLEPHLVEFGCMPSFNIYDIQSMGADGNKTPFRFAGGHIHFGIGKQNQETIERIVKSLDNVLGILSVLLFEKIDHPIRRQYYGLVGEYRLPPHGLEYRTLSNAWLQHPKLTYQVLDLAQKIVEYTLVSKLVFNSSEQDVIQTILTCNVNMAKEILEKNLDVFKLLNYNILDLVAEFKEEIHETWIL